MPSNAIGKLWGSALKKDGGTGSKNMAVDGSSTPVEFIFEPGTDYDYDVHTMCLLAEFAGSIAIGNQFIMDTVGTLSNGLLVEAKFSDDTVTVGNMKRTRDLVEVTQPQGGFNVIQGTVSLWQVFFYLPPFARLCRSGTYSVDDYIKVTVRDDLTDFNQLECFLQGTKI